MIVFRLLPVFLIAVVLGASASSADIDCPPYTRLSVHDRGQMTTESCWRQGVVHGPWEQTRADGTPLLQGEYDNGKRVGTWTSFGSTGSVEAIVDWRNGRIHGRSQLLLRNGTLKQDGRVVNGAREGTWSIFYDDGQIETEVDYVKGQRNGRYQSWHENGQLLQSGGFKNDREDGQWTTRGADGTVEEKGLVRDGTRVGSWTYGAKGSTAGRVVDHGSGQTHSMRQIMSSDGQLEFSPEMPPDIVRKNNRDSL